MTQKPGPDLWATLKAVWYVITPHVTPDLDRAETLAALARDVGRAAGLADGDLDSLACAALLHDIGQVRVRETVLKKPGRLTREEFLEIQGHPIESEKILNMMPGLDAAASWSRWHHEWWDGSGYPDRLAGVQIPLPARILAVVDAYDAMQSERPWRAAKSREETISELRLMAGLQFDPGAVRALQTAILESGGARA